MVGVKITKSTSILFDSDQFIHTGVEGTPHNLTAKWAKEASNVVIIRIGHTSVTLEIDSCRVLKEFFTAIHKELKDV